VTNNTIIATFLICCTIFDIKSKQIPVKLIIFFSFVIVGLCFINNHFFSWDFSFRLIPGAFLLLVAFITNQAIGYGDGIIVILIGMMLNFQNTITVILIAFFLSAIASIYILITKKGNRQTKLPFVPFLLTSWCIYLIF